MRKLKKIFVLSLVFVMTLVTNITYATTFNGAIVISGEQDENGVFTDSITVSYEVEDEQGIKTVDCLIDDDVCGSDDFSPGTEFNQSDEYVNSIGSNFDIPVEYLQEIKNDTLAHEAKIKVTDSEGNVTYSDPVEFKSNPAEQITDSKVTAELAGKKTNEIHTGAITLNVTGENENAGILGLAYFIDANEDEEVYADYSPGTAKNPGDDIVNTASESFELDMNYFAENEPANYTHTITVSVINGNDEVTQEVIEFKVNVTTPEISINAQDGYTYGRNFTVKATANDLNPDALIFDMEVEKDGTSVKSVSGANAAGDSYETEGTGKYKVTARATDAAGNTAEKTVEFEIDDTKPGIDNLEFTGAKNEGYDWFKDAVTIKTTAYDKDELRKITLKVNGEELLSEELSTAEYDLEYTVDAQWLKDNPAGAYNVEVTVEDEAENTRTIEDTFYAALAKPSLSITGAEDEKLYTGELQVKAEVSEEYAEHVTTTLVIENEDNIVAQNTGSGSASCTISDDGTYFVTASATDPAGNVTEREIVFTIDSTSPQVTNVTVTGELKDGFDWYSGPVTIAAKASDDNFNKMHIEVNGVIVKESSDPQISVTLDKEWFAENEADHYNVEIIAEDTAGNTGNETAEFDADLTAPVITIKGLADGYAKDAGQISLNVSDMSDVTTYIEVNDGQTTETYVKQGKTILLSDLAEFDTGKEYSITAYSTDAAGNVSEPVSAEFKFDTEGPAVTGPTFEGDKIDDTDFYSTPVKVSFSAEDAKSGLESIMVTVNDKTVYEGTEAGTVTLNEEWILDNTDPDGKYVVKVTAKDTSGNKTEKSETIYISASKPVAVVSGIENIVTAEKQTLTVEAVDPLDDNLTTYITVNRNGELYEEIVSDEATTTFSAFNDDGLYEISVYVKNSKGIKSETVTAKYTKDSTNPTIGEITFSGASTDGWYNGDVRISANVKDSSDIASAVITINGTEAVTLTPNATEVDIAEDISAEWITANKSEDGTYNVKITVKDEAGNTSSSTGTFKADVSAPVITLSGITDGSFVNKVPTLTVETEDDYNVTTKMTITLDGEAYDEVSGNEASMSYSNFTKDGNYVINVRATDAGGNTSGKKTISFTLDTAKPVIDEITLSGNANDGWYNGDVTVKSSIKDATSNIASLIITVNGTEIINTAPNKTDAAIDETITRDWIEKHKSSDGKYTVKVTVKDQAGNTETSTKTFNADVSAPKVTLSGITDGSFLKKTPTLTVKTEDDYSASTKITITKDGKTFDEITKKEKTITYNSFTEDGLYKITVQAEDAGGNKSEAKIVSFTKDTEAPEVSSIFLTGTRKDGFMWFSGDVKASATATDATSKIDSYTITINNKTVAEKTLDGSPAQKISHNVSKDWIRKNMAEDGRYDIYFTVTDRAGNTSTVYDTFYADLDTPAITVSGFENGAFLNTTPTFKLVVDDDYSHRCTSYITVKKDGKKFFSEKHDGAGFEYKGFTKDGFYEVSAYTVDEAGNTSKTKKLSFTKDTVAPVVTLSGAKEGEFTNNDRKITVNVKEKNYSSVKVDVKGTKKVRKAGGNLSFGAVKPDKVNYSISKTYKASGSYEFKVTATDAAGNVARGDSLKFTIDKEKPKITITDIPKQNNYKSKVAPKIEWEDDNIGKATITLTRASGGKTDGLTFTDKKGEYKGSRTYSDFVKKKAYDDEYTLICTIADKAGNTHTEKVIFTVNRFGSKFSLSDESKKINREYVKEVGEDIVIYEKNVSGLKTQETFVYKDGERIDATVTTKETAESGWHNYAYKFNKNSFEEEGVYTINIVSLDKAGNTSEYMKEGKTPFKFSVDKTPPMISVTGVHDRGNYKDGATAVIEVRDAVSVKSCRVAVKDGSKVLLEKDLTEKGGEIEMPEGRDLTLLVYATDEAGNKGKETISDITTGISASSSFAKVGLLLLAAVALILFIIVIKKRKNDE